MIEIRETESTWVVLLDGKVVCRCVSCAGAHWAAIDLRLRR